MATIIDMPKLSDTMTTGTLVSWLKNEGDAVELGDMIAEVETDKAVMELENFESGFLIKQYVKPGEQVPIGSPIAAVGQKQESAPTIDNLTASSASTNTAHEPDTKPTQENESDKEKKASSTDQATKLSSPTPPPSSKRIKASPLAKKIAEEKQLSLKEVIGSGPGGRIVKADVLAALEKKGATQSTSAHPCSWGNSVQQEQSTPISSMRQTIAKHLLHSKTHVPHFYLNIEVDAAALDNLRRELNDKLSEIPAEKGGIKLTINDFILKATAEAIRRVPKINSAWGGERIQHYSAVHLAFGVAIEDGLVTPVIQNAHSKSLRQISLEAKELVQKARNKKLSPTEMSGSTFTVTNLGMFGINEFYGIINEPNAGILSVGAIIQKPVIQNNTIIAGKTLNIGFSGDHRVIDGAVGADFLQTLKAILEQPALMLV